MIIEEFVQRLLGHMGIDDAKVTVEESEERVIVQITISEEDSGLLIGYHGEILSSLQKVLQLTYREDEKKKIIVNINDYKQKRETQLKEMTTKIAYRVLESGQEYVFSFLPANERLIVHQTLSENPEFSELESVSEGEGSDRRLHIRKKIA